jgi:hypothetical protein
MHSTKNLCIQTFELNNLLHFIVFICLGRQTKQIMVAKFQTLMLLIANAETSPLFWRGNFP